MTCARVGCKLNTGKREHQKINFAADATKQNVTKIDKKKSGLTQKIKFGTIIVSILLFKTRLKKLCNIHIYAPEYPGTYFDSTVYVICILKQDLTRFIINNIVSLKL